ncbi:MAG TPA: sigma-70 family RNA polymerase sigma factor [Verrucomicrobiae bacterium]|nr:sigma-70 family RNA polymerase sigma factor [Verrucomicrobiae bacterium]
MTDESEAGLLARCRAGEAGAWNDLFDRHYGPAARFIFQMSPDLAREDMEEICQEAFLSVIRNLDSFQSNSLFQTWLFRIAANKTRDFIERRKTAKRGGGQTTISLQSEDPETGLAPDPPSAAPSPDTMVMRHEQMVEVRRALDALGDPCREILELRYFGDLSYEEISAALKMNPKTVSSRLSKCLDRLREISARQAAGEKNERSPV